MLIHLAAVALLPACGSGEEVVTFEPSNFGGVSEGDTEEVVTDQLGEPDTAFDRKNGRGQVLYEVWNYCTDVFTYILAMEDGAVLFKDTYDAPTCD